MYIFISNIQQLLVKYTSFQQVKDHKIFELHTLELKLLYTKEKITSVTEII